MLRWVKVQMKYATTGWIILLSIFLSVVVFFALPTEAAQSYVECWQFTSQAACTTNSANGCTWQTRSGFWGSSSWCERISCFSGDSTNQTYCETTLKNSNNLSCSWSAGSSLGAPSGGGFLANACADLNKTSRASTILSSALGMGRIAPVWNL